MSRTIVSRVGRNMFHETAGSYQILTRRTTTLACCTIGLTRLGKSRTSLTKFKIRKTSWIFVKMRETCSTMRETSVTSCYYMVRGLTIARGRTKFSKILENLVRTVMT